MEEAKAAAADLLAREPSFRISVFESKYPLRRPGDRERLISGLRAAGLPAYARGTHAWATAMATDMATATGMATGMAARRPAPARSRICPLNWGRSRGLSITRQI